MSYEVVNVRDKKHGRTPLLEACLMNRFSIVDGLVNSKLQAGMLCACQDNEVCSLLLFQDVNVTDDAGMTPLHCVCASPEEDVEYLSKLLLDLKKYVFPCL